MAMKPKIVATLLKIVHSVGLKNASWFMFCGNRKGCRLSGPEGNHFFTPFFTCRRNAVSYIEGSHQVSRKPYFT